MTAKVNSSLVTCHIGNLELQQGAYWVSIGLKDSDRYMVTGRTSIVVFDGIKFTSVEPSIINDKATGTIIYIKGDYDSLLAYYSRYQSLIALKIELSSIIDPLTKKPLMLSLDSLTN